MPSYKVEINRSPFTQAEISELLTRADSSHKADIYKCLISLLYLTGARPVELAKLKASDFIQHDNPEVIGIRLSTAKLKKGKYYPRTRTLFINKKSAFMENVLPYVQSLPLETPLFPFGVIRMRQIIYAVSDKTICPYVFRHMRLTALAESGAGVNELMSWKGSQSIASVAPYIASKPLTPRLIT